MTRKPPDNPKRIGVMTLDGITYWLYLRDGQMYPVNAGWLRI